MRINIKKPLVYINCARL